MSTEDLASAKKQYQRSLIKVMFVFSFIIVTFAGLLWYFNIFSNPERTFWDTVDANLRVNSYSRVVTQEQPDSKLTNITTMQFGADPIARDVSSYVQEGDTAVRQVTESIGTTDTNYFAYKRVEGDIKNTAGEPIDTSSITNIYGFMDLNSPEAATAPQTFRNAQTGPQLTIPFANLSREQRQEFVQYIKDNKVFEVDFKNVSKNKVHGRSAYQYNVKIDIEQYLKMLQKLDEFNGTDLFSGFDSGSQKGQTFEMVMSIDINARQILELEHTGQGTTEKITGYNGHYPIEVPKTSIPFTELNQRIAELLQ